MVVVPEHLLPHLHYADIGHIKGDTPEAQQFIHDNGLNSGALEEFWGVYKKYIEAIDLILKATLKSGFQYDIPYISPDINLIDFEQIKRLMYEFRIKSILTSPQHDEELMMILSMNTRHNAYFPLQALAIIDALVETIQKEPIIAGNNTRTYRAFISHLENRHFVYAAKTAPLRFIDISNYFSIKNLRLDNLTSNEIYILGRNGDGKTLILQAMLLAAQFSDIVSTHDKALVGKLSQYLRVNRDLKIEAETISGTSLGNKLLYVIRNIYAYGAHRHQHTADPNSNKYDPIGFLTLFENDKELYSPDQWLLDTRFRELEAKERGENIAMTSAVAKSLLESLLNDEEEGQAIQIEIRGFERKVYYTERNAQPVGFEQLSSGYQSVMLWVADLVARLAQAQPYVKALEDFEAIVLVDEVGLHLHPKWEYTLMRKLRKHFPKIQFIVTTHSPILLMGASEDAIIYKIKKEEGQTKVVGSIPQKELRDMMSNQIITSPLFGLDTMAPPNFDPRLATDNDFITDKIHDVIRQRLAQRNTLDDEEIMRWINEELDNLPPIE